MSRKGRKENWDDEWNEEWDDEWDENEDTPRSPLQRLMGVFGGRPSNAGDLEDDDDDELERGSGLQGIATWSRVHWQRTLALVCFLIGLVLILRLAVVHATL